MSLDIMLIPYVFSLQVFCWTLKWPVHPVSSCSINFFLSVHTDDDNTMHIRYLCRSTASIQKTPEVNRSNAVNLTYYKPLRKTKGWERCNSQEGWYTLNRDIQLCATHNHTMIRNVWVVWYKNPLKNKLKGRKPEVWMWKSAYTEKAWAKPRKWEQIVYCVGWDMLLGGGTDQRYARMVGEVQ